MKIIIWNKGHTTHEIDIDAEGAIGEAQAIFAKARGSGMLAVRTAPRPMEAIREYDPEAETIEFFWPIAGG